MMPRAAINTGSYKDKGAFWANVLTPLKTG